MRRYEVPVMGSPDARGSGVGAELAGLDALDVVVPERAGGRRRAWATLWPKLAATATVLLAWQAIVWSGWRPGYVLPGPGAVFSRLWQELAGGDLPRAVAVTLRRAALGYGAAVSVGIAVGLAIAHVRHVRTAFGSLVTGLQTMPSIAWFPLAVLLFGLTESAIGFVVVLGAAPAIANGLIAGVDHIPPILLRAGRVLGARGADAYRYVVLPAALPSFIGGLKQGWAFAWRSLMAGELLGIIGNRPSIGTSLQNARDVSDAEGLVAAMVLILVIGIVVDSFFFATLDRTVRRRWGLLDPAR